MHDDDYVRRAHPKRYTGAVTLRQPPRMCPPGQVRMTIDWPNGTKTAICIDEQYAKQFASGQIGVPLDVKSGMREGTISGTYSDACPQGYEWSTRYNRCMPIVR